MSTRHDDNDGSDIFWPGYVDATTNLILNLLFLLTILIVAVFMFALELGRSSKLATENPPAVSEHQQVAAIPSQAATDPVKENIELKREIQRLNEMLARQTPRNVQAGGTVRTVDATVVPPKPRSGLDRALNTDFEIMVRFSKDAIAFTPAELEQLRESLRPVLAGEKVAISVEVPAGFSEAKRLGFYRAMAVRNLLIEMNLPGEKIDVSVTEGATGANASVVRVRSH